MHNAGGHPRSLQLSLQSERYTVHGHITTQKEHGTTILQQRRLSTSKLQVQSRRIREIVYTKLLTLQKGYGSLQNRLVQKATYYQNHLRCQTCSGKEVSIAQLKKKQGT